MNLEEIFIIGSIVIAGTIILYFNFKATKHLGYFNNSLFSNRNAVDDLADEHLAEQERRENPKKYK